MRWLTLTTFLPLLGVVVLLPWRRIGNTGFWYLMLR